MNPEKLSTIGKKLFRLIEFDEDEALVAEIHKHPIGLVFIYIMGTFVATAFFVIFIVGAAFLSEGISQAFGISQASYEALSILFGFLFVLASLAMMAIGAYLYINSVIIVTSEKLAQVIYRTIFDRKISQLSIGDVQDVTVKQTGLFAHLFNYGTIVVETAGEQQNYTFTYTPHPYEAAKTIVGAHETNLKKFGN